MPLKFPLRSTAALAGAVLMLLAGCRVLRCARSSEEAIAATRQLSLQAIDARERGQLDKADALFVAAVTKCPHDERARCGYAESLWRRGAKLEAITHMQEAVRLSGNDPQRMVQLGQMVRQQGDLEKAAEQAEKAIAANPQLASAWALAGDVYAAKSDRTSALAAYHRALANQPCYVEVQLAIANIYLQEKRPQRSLATLQAAAANFSPGQVPTPVLLGQAMALRELGQPREAAQALVQIAQRGEASADMLTELARLQMLGGEANAARATLASAIDREPSHAGAVALMREIDATRGVTFAAAAVP